jgi:hypothetical protein
MNSLNTAALLTGCKRAAAGRDEGAFLDQIEHVAGAAGRAIPVLAWNGPV